MGWAPVLLFPFPLTLFSSYVTLKKNKKPPMKAKCWFVFNRKETGGGDQRWNQYACEHNCWLAISLSLAGDLDRGVHSWSPAMRRQRRLCKWLSAIRDFHETRGLGFRSWLWFVCICFHSCLLPCLCPACWFESHWNDYCRCWLHKTQGMWDWGPDVTSFGMTETLWNPGLELPGFRR